MSKSVFRQAFTVAKKMYFGSRMLVFTLFLVPFSSLFAHFSQIPLDSKTILLMNAKTGGVVYEKNGYDINYVASLTKLGTMLYLLETYDDFSPYLTADKSVLSRVTEYEKICQGDNLPPYQLETRATHMHLRHNEKLPLKSLMEGMMAISANDAANVIAHNLADSVEDFMRQMNAFFQKKGFIKTQFLNPHGLHHKEHLSSAFEIALMFKKCMYYPLFNEIMRARVIIRPKTNLQPLKKITQINRHLQKGRYFYPKTLGGKTGYTKEAGFCLATSAKNEKDVLIAVLLGGSDPVLRYQDAIRLFEAAFILPKQNLQVLKAGIQTFTKKLIGAKTNLKTWIEKDVFIEIFQNEELNIQSKVRFFDLELPIKRYEPVGEVMIYNQTFEHQKHLLAKVPLLAANDVNPMLLEQLIQFFKRVFVTIKPFCNWQGLSLLLLLTIFIVIGRKKKLKN